ncbi:Uncharacterized protein HZ326_19396 [Fusarium oxysporum f. sp. albedinis]|nr:Uncharacterized protein HZ326_19396 [Fusarium oxysporum f. sp. albedinis]
MSGRLGRIFFHALADLIQLHHRDRGLWVQWTAYERQRHGAVICGLYEAWFQSGCFIPGMVDEGDLVGSFLHPSLRVAGLPVCAPLEVQELPAGSKGETRTTDQRR